ncbi:MAG: hypothetical protein ORN50_05565 [Crocinitomicaceae bacterium]|jgi:hypothetical protein|nr:hypothetical protein [Crocinitomicaceae bacterium]
MDKIENIKKQITQFLIDTRKKFNNTDEIDKNEYVTLLTRIDELVAEDFISVEAYNHFFKYWYQEERSTSRLIVQKSLEDKYIESGWYLRLINDFDILLEKLK